MDNDDIPITDDWRDEEWTSAETTELRATAGKRPLLIVKGSLFFAKRAADGKCMLEVSPTTIAEVAAQFPYVFTMITGASQAVAQAARDAWPDKNNFQILPIIAADVTGTINNMLNILRDDFGVSVRKPRDTRTLSWLNIEKYIIADDVTVVGPEDHAKIGLVADKEPDLNEMIRRRSENDWI